MKTYNQFLETPFSEEVKPEPPEEEQDNQIASKQKRQMQIKKQVLLKKMQAVRAGAGADIVASHTPEGEVIDEKKKGLDGKECWDGYKLAGTKKKDGKTVDNCVKVKEDYYRGTGEKVVARTKKWMDKKGQKGAPGLDAMKARTAEHKAKRGVKEEVVDEAKVDKGRSDYGKASIRNYRRKGPGHGEPAMFDPENKRGKLIDKRREEHKARRGVKGAKVPAYKVSEGTDKAFEYVKKQIAAKYGKSGYVSKDNPRKPQTAAEKAKVRAHQAKVDKENAAARAKDPSQGRYPKG